MPSLLQFPMKKANPEKSLELVLQNHNVHDFGQFGIWYAQINLGYDNKWLKKYDRAKIDTGASISLFPEKYANTLQLDAGIPYEFYGVNREDNCEIKVKLRKVDLIIMDYLGETISLEGIYAAFSALENAPILLGVKDVLDQMKIGFKNKNNTLTLELIS